MPHRPGHIEQDLSSLPSSEQGVYELQRGDIRDRQRLLEEQEAAGGLAYGRARGEISQARDIGMEAGRTSALMPVYSMMSQSGLAGTYSGGQTQAASQASLQAGRRANEIGATYADRLAGLELQQEQSMQKYQTERAALTTEDVQRQADERAAVDKAVTDDITLMREENWMDYNYTSSLLTKAHSIPNNEDGTLPRAKLAYIQAAITMIDTGDYGSAAWLFANPWARELVNAARLVPPPPNASPIQVG